MTVSKVTTAAFLAGATTLAVSLPMQAAAAEKEYDLKNFETVSVTAGLSADIEIGEAFSVTAEAKSNRTLDRLDISVRGDELIIDRDPSLTDWSLFAARRDAVVKVTLPLLYEVSASAGSDVTVTGDYGAGLSASSSSGADVDLNDVTGGDLKLEASSGANLNAEGVCETVIADASSGADIDAANLECDAAVANASSGANVEVHAKKSVVADASSGGDVDVYGDPASVDQDTSSGGDVDLN